MATSLWDSGGVAASLAVVRCDRCGGKPQAGLDLQGAQVVSSVRLCLDCFCELARRIELELRARRNR